MECDSCGRYVPSADVLPTLDGEGRLSMACARCREPQLPTRAVPPPALTSLITGLELPAIGLVV